MSVDISEWLTPEQAAERLPRFTVDWVRIQLRTGVLEGTKVGGRWFTNPAAIDKLLQSGTNVTSTPRRRRRRVPSTT